VAQKLHLGFTWWLTGMQGADKTTMTSLLEEWLRRHGALVDLPYGDEGGSASPSGLSFTKEDRDEHIRRIGFVAELLSRDGVIAIVAAMQGRQARVTIAHRFICRNLCLLSDGNAVRPRYEGLIQESPELRDRSFYRYLRSL